MLTALGWLALTVYVCGIILIAARTGPGEAWKPLWGAVLFTLAWPLVVIVFLVGMKMGRIHINL